MNIFQILLMVTGISMFVGCPLSFGMSTYEEGVYVYVRWDEFWRLWVLFIFWYVWVPIKLLQTAILMIREQF